MGCSTSKSASRWWQQQPQHRIYGAGCMFINDTHTLAGIHTPRRNHQVRVCGFGGKTEGEESWWQTAFRETIEEFFHVTTIPNKLYKALKSIEPVRILYAEDYNTLVYTFRQLKTFLKMCASHIPTSPLYAQMPRSVEELVFGRNVGNMEGVEIMDIVFWPLKNPHRRFRITREFIGDLKAVQPPGQAYAVAQSPSPRV
jgi:hypothetical protein